MLDGTKISNVVKRGLRLLPGSDTFGRVGFLISLVSVLSVVYFSYK